MKRRAFVAPLLATAVLSLSACSGGEEDVMPRSELTGDALCAKAFENQQVAAEFTPASPDQAKPAVASLIGVGTVRDGLCIDTQTEFYGTQWQLTSITLSAVPEEGSEAIPYSYSRTTVMDNEFYPFFVPVQGCATVSGVITLTHGMTGQVHTWTAEGNYNSDGEKC